MPYHAFSRRWGKGPRGLKFRENLMAAGIGFCYDDGDASGRVDKITPMQQLA
jgi:hypothetical protein